MKHTLLQLYKKNRWRLCAGIFVAVVGLLGWLHVTNPYAAITVVQQPYVTHVQNGRIIADKRFSLRVLHGPAAAGFGYWVKNGFTLAQNAFFGSKPTTATTTPGIIGEIHHKRFDPSKPYLISGDQFSVLYPRNLGVFYHDLLNPYTAHGPKDWENRQRIYLQSALYALDAFSAAGELTTTIEPIGPRTVLLVQVHPGSVPSDTLYGIFYALQALQDENRYPDAPYKLQTAATMHQIIQMRQQDLKQLLAVYLRDVQDPETGMIKRHVVLSGARDGVHREGSFYDNVVLWRTLGLAKQLGASDISDAELVSLRQTILQTYWDEHEGHFADDLKDRPRDTNYSSDWLIALPTGFLSSGNPADLQYLERSVAFMRARGITNPLPVKYTAESSPGDVPWAIRTFVPNYGSNAIWSYWGAEYLTLVANLYHQTQNQDYYAEAQQGIAAYSQKIELYRGFPETFTPQGEFLSNALYKSIRQTGWVVQFETAMHTLDPDVYAKSFVPQTHQTKKSSEAPETTCEIWLCRLR